MTPQEDALFRQRLARHHDELRWLYMELYDNGSMFAELCDQMYRYAEARSAALKERDAAREADPNWYKHRDLLGMMLYIDNFAGNLDGVRGKLDYLEEAGVNCLHLMPFLDTVKGRDDGGYAVADFRTVRPDLGTMEDLEQLTAACHDKGMNVCMDFVMNHTSCDHEWARRAKAGEGEYMSRYFFFDSYDIPAEYEKTCPQVFPTTAPGNFTQLPDGRWVMTTFYPYQWDLNYANPRVFNEMMYNFLYLANRGMDIIRIDAVPYITVDKPECHLLYNVTTMCTTWHTVATHDTRLLRKQLDSVNGLPKEYVFLNYLRCHDDIGWGLDYDTLRSWGMEEVPHKKYLNEFFQGRTAGSVSRGELYNDDPTTGDARFCGTTASMCGLETAATAAEEDTAIRFDLCLHAMMLFQSGIPMLYSGDEIGQLNDYSYKADPDKAADSRYVHRGRLPWARAAQRTDSASPAGRIFAGLRELETIRRQNPAFEASAAVDTLDTGSLAVLGIRREAEGEELIGLFNFGGEGHAVPLPAGGYADLLTGEPHTGEAPLQPYGFILLQKQ